MEAAPGFEPGIKDLQSSALPLGYAALNKKWSGRRDLNPRPQPWQGCALPLSYFRLSHSIFTDGGETQNRTGDTRIFSPLLYLLSYLALLVKEMAGLTRLELATSGVTGRRSNRLSYNPIASIITFDWFPGGRNRVRTCDPLRVRQVLFR